MPVKHDTMSLKQRMWFKRAAATANPVARRQMMSRKKF